MHLWGCSQENKSVLLSQKVKLNRDPWVTCLPGIWRSRSHHLIWCVDSISWIFHIIFSVREMTISMAELSTADWSISTLILEEVEEGVRPRALRRSWHYRSNGAPTDCCWRCCGAHWESAEKSVETRCYWAADGWSWWLGASFLREIY